MLPLPSLHDERVIDRNANDLVNTGGGKRVGELVVTWHVRGGARGRERSRKRKRNHRAFREQRLGVDRRPIAVIQGWDDEFRDSGAFKRRVHEFFKFTLCAIPTICNPVPDIVISLARPLICRHTLDMSTIRDHTRDLEALTTMLTDHRGEADILPRALEALETVIPYDLASVFKLADGTLRVVASAGKLASRAIENHSLELRSFPTIIHALERRLPIALLEHHHSSEEGDPYDGVLDLPAGHSCMVIPLHADGTDLGVITLDRTTCGQYDEQSLRLAGVYGQLVSLAMWFADREALLRRGNQRLRERNRYLREQSGSRWAQNRLSSARSAAMQGLVRQAQAAAPSNLPILIRGETGTGKELVAEAIHGWSDRSNLAFVKLNCAAIAENLVESELFGHVRGAFSGADSKRDGRFLTANGGTLLLDEVGELPLPTQAKLLRVLQEGTFEPVGSDETMRVDVRVLAATNLDLEAAIAENRFRADLYYRLAVIPLLVPPLRDRIEEIESIADDVLISMARGSARGPWTLSAAAVATLRSADWPGNVRELRSVIERATLSKPRGVIDVADLALSPTSPERVGSAKLAEFGTLPTFAEHERDFLAHAMKRASGKLYGNDGAAALLGLRPSTLRSKLVKHGLR